MHAVKSWRGCGSAVHNDRVYLEREVKMLKRIVLVLAVALLAMVGLAAVWMWNQATSPGVAHAVEETSDHSPAQAITVVGQGSVHIEPDVARVSIGVETMAETVGEAVDENGVKMDALLAALVEAGVAEKDIQTMNYSVHLERYPEPMPRVSGTESEEPQPQYRVSNMVNVTIRDLDSVGVVLDAVIEAGANNIWGVNFSLEDSTAAEADARAKAVDDAQARAESLAELGGVELGPVMSISEVIGGGAVPVSMLAAERAAGGAGPISPGEVEISYQLQVSYFIEP
jgi:uncharacterized protein YggE